MAGYLASEQQPQAEAKALEQSARADDELGDDVLSAGLLDTEFLQTSHRLVVQSEHPPTEQMIEWDCCARCLMLRFRPVAVHRNCGRKLSQRRRRFSTVAADVSPNATSTLTESPMSTSSNGT